jgi:hypothetical protein
MLERSAHKCAGIYGEIKAQILQSSVVGSDETNSWKKSDLEKDKFLRV